MPSTGHGGAPDGRWPPSCQPILWRTAHGEFAHQKERGEIRARKSGLLLPVCNRRQQAAGRTPAGRTDRKKMLIYDERSRNVYENNKNRGIMSDEKSDIYVDTTCILQKSAGFDGQFWLNSAFATCFLRRFAAIGGAVIKISICTLPCNEKGPQSNSSRSRMTFRRPFMPHIPESLSPSPESRVPELSRNCKSQIPDSRFRISNLPRVSSSVSRVRCYTACLAKCTSH